MTNDKHQGHISYDQLLEIISWAIFTKPVIKNQCHEAVHLKSINGAIYGGKYIGSPGKDIYLMLPYLSDEQMNDIAVRLSKKFPTKPPHSNVQFAACIRYIYGQFEKQGILRSEKDFRRMKRDKLDWNLPRQFLKLLSMQMHIQKKHYGLTILYEMEAHRLGDEAVINADRTIINNMEETYLQAIYFAQKCKSYKHLFSLYYWASQYFMKFGDKDNTIKYIKLAIKNAGKYYHKYFPSGEQYYSIRLSKCARYMYSDNKRTYLEFIKNIDIKSKKLRQTIKKITNK